MRNPCLVILVLSMRFRMAYGAMCLDRFIPVTYSFGVGIFHAPPWSVNPQRLPIPPRPNLSHSKCELSLRDRCMNVEVLLGRAATIVARSCLFGAHACKKRTSHFELKNIAPHPKHVETCFTAHETPVMSEGIRTTKP